MTIVYTDCISFLKGLILLSFHVGRLYLSHLPSSITIRHNLWLAVMGKPPCSFELRIKLLLTVRRADALLI